MNHLRVHTDANGNGPAVAKNSAGTISQMAKDKNEGREE